MNKPCDATCKPWVHYGTGRKIIQDCSCSACVEIDGSNLCLKHAGAIAVRKLIHLGLAKQIPRVSSVQGVCDMDKH